MVKVLVVREIYQIYNDTHEIDGFIEDWDKCKSELIVLVRNRFDVIIAIINIESDYKNDFHVDDKYKGTYDQELTLLLKLFANHVAVVFELEDNIRLSSSAGNIIKNIGRSGLNSKYDLYNSLFDMFKWTSKKDGLIRSVFLLVNLENTDSSYKSSSIKQLYNNSTFPDFDEETVKNITVSKKVTSYDKFPTKCTASELSDLFSYSVKTFTNVDGYETINYLQTYSIEDDYNSNEDRTVILLSVYDKNNSTTLSRLEHVFNIAITKLVFILNYQEMKYQNLISKSIAFLNSSSFKNDYMSSILNDLSNHVAKSTSSDLCMIYLTVHERHEHEEMKFFIGGQGGNRKIEDLEKRFPAKTIIGSMIQNENRYYFCDNYFECSNKSEILDDELHELGFKSPTLHAHLLYAKKRQPIGAIVILKEEKSYELSTDNIGKNQIKKYISDLSFHIGNVIQSKTLYYIDEILSNTYKSFFDRSNDDEKFTELTKIDKFQSMVNAVIKKSLLPISGQLYFTIYRRTGKTFNLLSTSGLDNDIPMDPPSFDINKGLTGSVMFQPSGEIFVPYVEDIRIKLDADLTPEIKCRTYWDYLIGDSQRFYYGKHLRVNTNEDYILLIIGHRTKAFYPSIAYKIMLDLVQNIGDHLQILLEDIEDNVKVDSSDEIEVLKKYLSSRGVIDENHIDLVFKQFNDIKNSDEDKKGKVDSLLNYFNSISTITKEGKSFTDSAIGIKENIEKIYDWIEIIT